MAAGEYELQALNFHSSICIEGSKITTFPVPSNMYIVSVGTLGAWTQDADNGNLGEKIVTGKDKGNRDISTWLKENYSTFDKDYGEILIYYPGIQCPDRNLGPDKQALVTGSRESEKMNWFTESNPEGIAYGSSQLMVQRAVAGQLPPRGAATAAAGKMLKGSHVFLSDFIEMVSQDASEDKKIILFILGCQVIDINASKRQGALFKNYYSARVAGQLLISLLGPPKMKLRGAPRSASYQQGTIHPDSHTDVNFLPAGYHDPPTIKKRAAEWLATNPEEKGKIPDIEVPEIENIAAKLVKISSRPLGGGRRRRRRRKKTQRISRMTRKKKTKRNKNRNKSYSTRKTKKTKRKYRGNKSK